MAASLRPPTLIRHMRFADITPAWQATTTALLPLLVVHDVVPGALADVTHFHTDFHSLFIVQKGRGTHVVGGVPYALARGDVYAMRPGMEHRYTDCDDLGLEALHFSVSLFDDRERNALAQTPGFQSLFVDDDSAGGGGGRWLHLTPDAYAPVAAILAELRAEWQIGTPSSALLVRAHFTRLLIFLARHAQRESEHLPHAAPHHWARDATVAAAVRYMDEHFAGNLRVEQVAQAVFLSRDRFTEVFAQAMGRTPRDYLRHLRVERAKTLLAGTDQSVTVIAQASGFGESAYLTRVLRAATGMTPSEYRRQSNVEYKTQKAPP